MTARERWFATSRFRPVNGPDRSDHAFMAIVHAKQLGTPLSACGKDTSSWFKHWMSFDSVSIFDACPECVRAVTGAAG